MKNKRMYSLLMVIVMIFSMFLSTSNIVLGASMEGAGTVASPYLIRTVDDLYSIPNNPAAHYRLINDLDLQNLQRSSMADFSGVLDGNNKTISNLKLINSSGYIGLFKTTTNASIKNLTFQNAQLESTGYYVGAITGYASNTQITNCSVIDSNIVSTHLAGAICGYAINGTSIQNSSVINVSFIGYNNVGPLVGVVRAGKVSNCYSRGGNIECNGYTGGLIGQIVNSAVSNCYSTTNISAADKYVGGLIGLPGADTFISNSFASNRVTGVSDAGGLVGYNPSGLNMLNSYFDQQIAGITAPTSQARTTAQMYAKANFIGWDFENTWNIAEGNDYPRLKFEPEIPEEPEPIRTLKVVLKPGEQLQLTVDDEITENTKMTWVSSDPTVTTVDSEGLIKALKKGNAVITVKSLDNSYTEEIKVLVLDNVNEYRLTIDLKVGEKCRLTIDDAEDLVGSWTSLDSSVAIVNVTGKVTAVGDGLTIITGYDEKGKEVGQVYVRVR